MKFREHRGSLSDAMKTEVDLPSTTKALADYVVRAVFMKGFPPPPEIVHDEPDGTQSIHMTVKPYGFDQRIGWDTHIVTIEGYGVVGWTDGLPADYVDGKVLYAPRTTMPQVPEESAGAVGDPRTK